MSYVTREPIQVEAWRPQAIDARHGASVEFLGIVRADDDVLALDYEAFAPMAERVIAEVIATAQSRWALHQVYVQHRVGRVPVGEVSIRIGVQAAHRAEAFEACRFVIDTIKAQAPIWKQEIVRSPAM